MRCQHGSSYQIDAANKAQAPASSAWCNHSCYPTITRRWYSFVYWLAISDKDVFRQDIRWTRRWHWPLTIWEWTCIMQLDSPFQHRPPISQWNQSPVRTRSVDLLTCTAALQPPVQTDDFAPINLARNMAVMVRKESWNETNPISETQILVN